MLKFINTILLFFSVQTILLSQVNQQWVKTFGSQTNSIYTVAGMAVDNSGNVFVSGSVTGASLTDFVTIKYNPNGIEQWAKVFTGLIEDRAIDMVLDNAGNVCVTGLSENQTGTYDIITIKYNTNGDSLWVKRYNGPTATTMDQPVAMTIDSQNNIYVLGYSFGTSPMAYITIKYNPSGDSLWVQRYLLGGSNLPRDIFIDNNGNVYVYGRSTLILKYDTNGNLLWNKSFPVNSAESNKVLTGDNNGNIYFAATKSTSTFDDFSATKINSNGDTLWTRVRNGLGNLSTNHDDAAAIAIDNNGNVFTTGEVYATSPIQYYFSTIKYNSNGDFQWERNYSAPQNGDGGNDIAIDNSGNIYVTGGSGDYTTIKYNTNGDSLWTVFYNGPANQMDIAEHIVIDNAGNVYVTGRSRAALNPAYYQIATIKYSQTPTSIHPNNNTAENFELFQNYPNPFNPVTNIDFQLPVFSYVSLKVFDALGKELQTLASGNFEAGNYSAKFDASDYPSGIYFYELKIGSGSDLFSDVKRMALVK